MKKNYFLFIFISLTICSFYSADGQIKQPKNKNKAISDTIHVIGHAHMDMNWLWTYSETMQMCNDNLRQVVAFMKEYPDYKMLQSQASVYNFVEMVDPPLFEEVKNM
jgi:alpha-mannosidase